MLPSKGQTEEASRSARRAVLIKELLASEQTHAEALKSVVVDYLNPLKAILSKDAMKKLFGNFEVIVGWNMQFLMRLKARYEESEDIETEQHGFLFGDIVVEMLVILRQLYSQYSENYELAQQTYKECLKIREFEHFIQTQSKTNCKTNLLLSLYLPIGRMIMYDSLIKDIVKLTSKDHIDYEDLLQAQKLIVSATRQADRLVEKRKNIESVLRIQAMLVGSDIAEPHRRYVYEGEVLLITAKPKKKKYEIEFMYPLGEIEIIDLEESRSSFKLNYDELEWIIDSEDKQTWLQMLTQTIKKLGSIPQEIYALKYEDEQVQTKTAEDNEDFKLTKKQLVDKILEWSNMKNGDDVLDEIKTLADKIKKQK